MPNDKLKLEKSAQQELAKGKNIPTIGQKEADPKKPWDEVKDEIVPSPDMIVFRVPEKTESGIILPNNKPLLDEDEYRPLAEIVGEDVKFVEPGDEMILHGQSQQAAVPLKYEGHALYMIHQQFVVGKRKAQ